MAHTVPSLLQRPTPLQAAPTLAPASLAIYIHWPFCRSKCPYCDFNSHVRDGIEESRWRSAYIRELDQWADTLGDRTIISVFFGGGTPSLMQPETAAMILDHIALRWRVPAQPEVTLEANPSTAEASRFRAFRSAGVNRLSLGVQALDDAALQFLGRSHSADEARDAVAIAAAVFPRYSFDLIWGRPGQTVGDWSRELADATALAGDHLSAYQLTIEPGTAFFRAGVPAAEEDLAAALFEATDAALDAAGLVAYEISNHAREGGVCRHNLAVWEGCDYLGIGPGAHGRITGGARTHATRTVMSPEKWLARVEARGSGLADQQPLDALARAEELVMTGLRLRAGISRAQFRERSGVALESVVDPAALNMLIDGGFLQHDAAGLRATRQGRVRLNAVLAKLLG